MERLTDYKYSAAWESGLAHIPKPILPMLRHVDLLAGADPLFVGLHLFKDIKDGRSYRNTAHTVYPHHQTNLVKTNRRTTVVLPTLETAKPWVVIHELGHVLDERLGLAEVFLPVNEYAKTNRAEAFACAFFDWCWWGNVHEPKATALFEELAANGL